MCDVNLTLLSLNVSTVAELTLSHLPNEADQSHLEAHADRTGQHKDNKRSGPFLASFSLWTSVSKLKVLLCFRGVAFNTWEKMYSARWPVKVASCCKRDKGKALWSKQNHTAEFTHPASGWKQLQRPKKKHVMKLTCTATSRSVRPLRACNMFWN